MSAFGTGRLEQGVDLVVFKDGPVVGRVHARVYHEHDLMTTEISYLRPPITSAEIQERSWEYAMGRTPPPGWITVIDFEEGETP